MLQVYCPQITNRVKYIVDFVFSNLLKMEVALISEKQQINAEQGIVINYSEEKVDGSLAIFPSGLLYSSEIVKQIKKVGYWDKTPVFFETAKEQDVPFDIFSAIFFLITRMEEYSSTKKDKHGRFIYTESAAFKHNFLQIPIVDIWCYKLVEVLKSKFAGMPDVNRKYRHISSIDVDNAYAFRFKGFARHVMGTIKSLSKFDLKSITFRYKVLLGLAKDPYDTYEFIQQHQDELADDSIYFFPVGDRSNYDRQLSYSNKGYQQLIRDINNKNKTGLHLSYAQGDDSNGVEKEMNRLFLVTGTNVNKNRYHFLRFNMPCSYQQLVKNQITEEYSMGYAGAIGFRSGTCTPFLFYNLTIEQVTPLRVFSFQVMDATLNNYLELSPELAMRQIAALIDQVKKVDGTFISLWHNENLSDTGKWKGWRKVFTFMMKQAKGNG